MSVGIYKRKPFTRTHRENIRKATTGDKNHSWRGGVSKIPSYQKEKGRLWREKNKEHIKNYVIDYRRKNKEHIREYDRGRDKKRRENPQFRLDSVIRNDIWETLKGRKRKRRWEVLVGYTLKELMTHIENQFEPWMNWSNWGKWHIDHIKPRSLFKYETAESPEFKKCWALDNLQPLEKMANLKKGNHFGEEPEV